MKTNFLKKVIAVILALMITILPLIGVEAEAASKAYMKTLNVSWDLKPDKAVTFKTKYAGISMPKGKVTIKNYKIKDAKKEGYKKLTFTVVFKKKTDFTPEQVHKMTNSEYCQETGNIGGNVYATLVDYTTGECLECENDYGVTVDFGDWEHLDKEISEDEHGCYVSIYKTVKAKVTVTYPKDYKELCIAVGGMAKLESENDDKFYAGKIKFGKTPYISKSDKSVTHIMRVNK